MIPMRIGATMHSFLSAISWLSFSHTRARPRAIKLQTGLTMKETGETLGDQSSQRVTPVFSRNRKSQNPPVRFARESGPSQKTLGPLISAAQTEGQPRKRPLL